MDLQKLISSLEESHKNLTLFESKQREIIQEEIQALISFVHKIFPFATKKTVNGEQAILIYVFPIGEKDVISHEVYLTETGDVTYQVYDEIRYRGFRPDAEVEKGFVKMSLTEFLKVKTLKDIVDFFQERPDVINDRSRDLAIDNEERKSFLNKFTQSLNGTEK